jgi:opacity protein-like surface antigen
MNNKYKIVLFAGFLSLSALSYSDMSLAQEQISADNRYLYLGTELGISTPPVDKFKHKNSGSKFTIKSSKMIGGRVGYSFYPDMAAEVSFTHQPKYQLSYTLPKKDISIGSIPETKGKTNVATQVTTINLVYNLNEISSNVQPYIILGAGVAKVMIKENFAATDSLAHIPGVGKGFKFFQLNKTSKNHFAWQVGGGVSKDLTENLSVDLSAKLQVVNSIKLSYSTFDLQQKKFVKQKPIKQTLGVAEFTFGVLWKLPV